MKKFILNSFVLYIIIWLSVLMLYQLHWTSLYPELELQLILFILLTCVVSLGCGLYFRQCYVYTVLPSPLNYYKPIIKYLKVAFVFLLMDFVYSGYCPLIG